MTPAEPPSASAGSRRTAAAGGGKGFPVAGEAGRVLRFLIAGGLTAGVNLGALYLLAEYGHLWKTAASVLAFVLSYGVNFTLQKFWTFRSRDLTAARRQLALHFSLALCNLALNTGIFYALIHWAHVWYMLAQVIAAAVITVDSFVLSRRIFA